MNHELFSNMQKQMTPSPEVRAALSEKLAQPAKKRPVPWIKYGAVAACAALVIGAFPLYQAMQPKERPLHSYVMAEGLTGYIAENTTADDLGSGEETYTGAAGPAPNTGALPNRDSAPSGDQDMDMTPEDLSAAMLDVGYTQEEIDEYQSIGYQMTWAKWWKFVHQQQNSEGSDPFNLDDLKIFSQNELYVNTGALPGGAYIGDVPVQVGAEAYEKLAPYVRPRPDWYGGAYLNDSGWLVVQLVEDKDPGDKSLELQVLDWADSEYVMFSSCKYSLAHLTELMDRLNALPDADPVCRDVMASWGVDEEANRIELTLTQVNDHILSLLAELDPDDDAIYVQVGQRASHDLGEDVRTDSAKTEDPAVHHVVPGGTTVPDDEDLIAVEPYYDGAHYDVEHLPEELPQEKRPAFVEVDSVPEEEVNTSSWAPQG